MWVLCQCGVFWCRVHLTHAFDCDCPEVDDTWSPYVDGGPPGADWEESDMGPRVKGVDPRTWAGIRRDWAGAEDG